MEAIEGTQMDAKAQVLEVMKSAGEPLNAGKVAEMTGLDRKAVDKAMDELNPQHPRSAASTM